MKKKLAFDIQAQPQIPLEEIPHLGKSYIDCVYDSRSDEMTFDLFLPDEGEGPFPLIIYIHTGAFAFGTKRDQDIRPMLPALERGYALASIDYRKSTDVNWPAQICDAKSAVRYLRAHAKEYHLRPFSFGVWGIAAGGYLASMLGVTGNLTIFGEKDDPYANVSSSVNAVVDWCSICGDLSSLDDQVIKNGIGKPIHGAPDSAESVMMGNPLDAIPELCQLASPCSYVQSDIPPFFIVHGKNDAVVPYQQSLEFATTIQKQAGEGRAKLLLLDGVGHHGDPWYSSEEASKTALDFFDSVL